jgi:hypothetical protein
MILIIIKNIKYFIYINNNNFKLFIFKIFLIFLFDELVIYMSYQCYAFFDIQNNFFS